MTDPEYDFVTDPNVYIVDHDGDEISERMVKFDGQALMDYLDTNDVDDDGTETADVVELTITGKVAGFDFEDSDTIRV